MKIASIQQKKVKRNQSATVCVLTEEGDSYELLYETLVKFGIYDGSDLDEKKWNSIQLWDSTRRATTAALRWLSLRPRSREEISNRLHREGYNDETITSVLEKLSEEKYIDDLDFAMRFAQSRLRKKAMGERALAYELNKKGIAPDLIRQVIQKFVPDSDLPSVLRLAEKKYVTIRESDQRKKQIKLSAFLQQRGFDTDTIRKVVEMVIGNKKQT